MFTETEEFKTLLPYVYVHKTMKEDGKPVYNVAVGGAPSVLLKILSHWTAPCVHCGELMHPLRFRGVHSDPRTALAGPYLAVACPISVKMGCTRGKAARNAIDEIVRLVDLQE